MNRVQFLGKSFNIGKENENDCETDRDKGVRAQPACHHFPAEVSSSSSCPPCYTYQSKFILRGRKKEQTTKEKEGVPHRGDRLHVAMSQPDGQSVIFLGIKIWSMVILFSPKKKRIWTYLGHLDHKKDESIVHKDYHLLIDSCAVDQVRLRSSLRHTNY